MKRKNKIKTLAQKYGKTGKKGRSGENWLKARLESKGLKVIDNESNMSYQITGKDLVVIDEKTNKTYSIDVKNNYRDDGCFYIEIEKRNFKGDLVIGWALNKNKTTDYIFHTRPSTGDVIFYKTKQLHEYLEQKGVKNKDHPDVICVGGDFLIKIQPQNYPDFLQFRTYNI